MNSNMKFNIKKATTLMLALLSLAALISIMPEHNSTYIEAQSEASHTKILAQK